MRHGTLVVRQTGGVIHLQGSSFDVVVDLDHGTPVIVHWGAPIDDPGAFAVADDRPLVYGTPDAVAPLSIVPEHGAGFTGRPGLRGHRRRGRHWAPRFEPRGHTPGGFRPAIEPVSPEFPMTLDLRRFGGR